jgi:hypothetical protein
VLVEGVEDFFFEFGPLGLGFLFGDDAGLAGWGRFGGALR